MTARGDHLNFGLRGGVLILIRGKRSYFKGTTKPKTYNNIPTEEFESVKHLQLKRKNTPI